MSLKLEVVGIINDLAPPRLDGFMGGFYKRYWSLIKGDIMNLIYDVFNDWGSLKCAIATFRTLILKASRASRIQDYHPISKVNIIYKIVSKLIANRLVEVNPGLLSLS